LAYVADIRDLKESAMPRRGNLDNSLSMFCPSSRFNGISEHEFYRKGIYNAGQFLCPGPQLFSIILVQK